MRFRFQITNGGSTFTTPWYDGSGNLNTSVRVASDLRLLYPSGVFVLEQQQATPLPPEQQAQAQAEWLNQILTTQFPVIDGGLI